MSQTDDDVCMLEESISDTSSSDGEEHDYQHKLLKKVNVIQDLSASNLAENVLLPNRLPELQPNSSISAESLTSYKSDASFVPLRCKSRSALNEKDAYVRKRSDSLTKETPERWKHRLWPSKAITAFCRILTRCKPPFTQPGQQICRGKLDLQAHWRTSELMKVTTVFDSASDHSSVFFLLAVEECRESVTNAEEPEHAEVLDKNNFSPSKRTGWYDGEITAIIAESESALLPKACDPRLGSVWVIGVAVSDSTNNGINYGSFRESGLSGGDLVVMHSPQWNGHVLLGIIQPWDPDYDIKFGTNFSHNQSSYLSAQQQQANGGGRPYSSNNSNSNNNINSITMVNILICVDSSDGLRTATSSGSNNSADSAPEDIGGWAPQGAVMPGVRLTMAVIGNVMTSIRECQALMSLKLINRSLQNMILTGSFLPNPQLITNAGTMSKGLPVNNGIKYTTSSTAGNNSNSSSSSQVSDCTSPTRDNRTTTTTTRLTTTPRKAFLEQPVRCPENVPMILWQALCQQYNESQLRAICMVSRRYQEREWNALYGNSGLSPPPVRHTTTSSSSSSVRSQCPIDSSLSLLQGPPGTGKTKTILGIISVFLAGALNMNTTGVTKIVAGASLLGDFNSTAPSEGCRNIIRGRVNTTTTAASNNNNNTTSSNNSSISSTVPMINPNPLLVASSGTAGNGIRKPRVLVCAPSNTAVDEIVYRLITQGVLGRNGQRMDDLSVVRIGQPSKMEYQRFTARQPQQHQRHKNSNREQQQQEPVLSAADENMVRIVERVSLENIVEERRKALLTIDKNSQSGATLKQSDLRKQVLDQADVVCSTLSGAGSQPMLEVILRITGFKFDAVIIDEAAQAVEPSSLIPFKYNPQVVVLVGDPCQLPATVFSRACKSSNYNQSLFQRLQIAGYPVLMLETQYRMHPLIAEYPSLRYYQGRLVTGSQLITSDSHKMPYHADESGKFRPFLFHNVEYSNESVDGTSICNRMEAKYVVDLFEELVRKYPEHKNGIGIIAPYRAQRRLLNNMFRERFGGNARYSNKSSNSSGNNINRQYSNSNNGDSENIIISIGNLDTEIATIDGFQGREKNIVIFSCVRTPQRTTNNHKQHQHSQSNSDNNIEPHSTAVATTTTTTTSSGGIGFLKEWQRLNVAITRARYSLWIVGHSGALKYDEEWGLLLNFAKNKNSFYNAAPHQQPISGANQAAPHQQKRANKNAKNQSKQQQHQQQQQQNNRNNNNDSYKYHKNNYNNNNSKQNQNKSFKKDSNVNISNSTNCTSTTAAAEATAVSSITSNGPIIDTKVGCNDAVMKKLNTKNMSDDVVMKNLNAKTMSDVTVSNAYNNAPNIFIKSENIKVGEQSYDSGPFSANRYNINKTNNNKLHIPTTSSDDDFSKKHNASNNDIRGPFSSGFNSSSNRMNNNNVCVVNDMYRKRGNSSSDQTNSNCNIDSCSGGANIRNSAAIMDNNASKRYKLDNSDNNIISSLNETQKYGKRDDKGNKMFVPVALVKQEK